MKTKRNRFYFLIVPILTFVSFLLLLNASVFAGHTAAGKSGGEEVFIWDGATLYVSTAGTLAKITDISTGTNALGSGGGYDDGDHMVVDTIGERIFIPRESGSFPKIFDYSLNSLLPHPQIPYIDEPLGLAVLPDGKILVTSEDISDGLWRLYKDMSIDSQTSYTDLYYAEGVAYDSTHNRIFIGDEDDYEIEILDGTTLDSVNTFGSFCTSDEVYWVSVDGSANRLFALADSRCFDPQLPQSQQSAAAIYGIHVFDIISNGDDISFNQTIAASTINAYNNKPRDCYGTLSVSETTHRLFAIDYCLDEVHIYDTQTLAFLGVVDPSRAGSTPSLVSVGLAPMISAPGSISFGSIEVNTAATQSIAVSNPGTANLVIGSIASPGSPFSVTSDTCSNTTLAPRGSCTVTVSFSPPSDSSFSNSFTIPSNAPSVSVAVDGSGILPTDEDEDEDEDENNPPSKPNLVFPEDGAVDLNTSITFKWKKSLDPDGDIVTYELSNCENADFSGCTPVIVEESDDEDEDDDGIDDDDENNITLAGLSGSGMFLLFGFICARSQNGKRYLSILILLAVSSGFISISCMGPHDKERSGFTSGAAGPAGEMSYTIPNTQTGYWQVTASDGKGGTASSDIWKYKTK